MKKTIYILVVILFVSGNVWQALNPRIEVKEKIVEKVKWKTKIKTKLKIVKVTKTDGTVIETTTEDTTTETDKDSSTESKKETKPKPLPLNIVLLGVNPRITTDLQVVYSRKVFGPLSAFVSGQTDLVELKPKFYVGAGLQF